MKREREGGRERERERKRETEKEREIERQRKREREKERERKKKRERERETERKYLQNCLSILFYFHFCLEFQKNTIKQKGKMKPSQIREAATDIVEMDTASIFLN